MTSAPKGGKGLPEREVYVYAVFLSIQKSLTGEGFLRTSRKDPNKKAQTDANRRFRQTRTASIPGKEGGKTKWREGLSWDPGDISVVVACRGGPVQGRE